ncbi:MAG: type II secretion system protein GspD [Bdellovibrionales bacterium]
MSQNSFKMNRSGKLFRKGVIPCLLLSASILAGSCAQVTAPDTRNVNIPSPKFANERQQAVNEKPDSVMYIPLGDDVLVPEAALSTPFPKRIVGPFELRGETLAGALQLILDGVDIPIAFESEEGLTRPITITNLKGELETVISRVCGLADLYCAYEDGILAVKETQLFTVTLPPIGEDGEFLSDVSGAIEEIVGVAPITDSSTRTIVYRASQRTSEIAESYFQRLRSNTALIIFETYIWEVSLEAGNSTGISWESIENFGKYTSNISISGVANPELGTPISIGLPTDGVLSGDKVFQFISEYGTVKTISQPQVTVLSGSTARFRVADTRNFVSEVTRSVDEGVTTVSTTTDSVDTGFTFEIESNWDKATVYGNIDILLQEVRSIDTFDDNPDAIVQLPQTTERELSTQVRIRPGDSLLIAGLVREIDNFSKDGPGFHEPLFPTSRTAQTNNVELVFLLRPRVVVYTPPTKQDMANLKAQYQKDLAIDQDAVVDAVIEKIKATPAPDTPVEVIEASETEGTVLQSQQPVEIIEKIDVNATEKPIGEPLPDLSSEDSGYVPIRPVFAN